jgi:ATP-dependent DNA ligase
MAKTKPIGVRFDEDILAELKELEIASSPQKALNYLISFYRSKGKDKDWAVNFAKKAYKEQKPTATFVTEVSHPIGGLSDEYRADLDKQVVALIKERDNPPKEHSGIGKKVWRHDRQKKIDELQKLLNP